jgi:thiol-disulfide isomerase/thioredoxin
MREISDRWRVRFIAALSVVAGAAIAGSATIAAVTGGANAGKIPVVTAEPPSSVVVGEMQNFTLHKVPQPVADIGFRNENGREMSLAGFRGRVVLLNLWATWCAPCRREMPDIDALQAKYGGDKFIVVALSQDRKGVQAVRDFYREIGVKNLQVFIDQKARTARKLRAPGLPTTLLLSAGGDEIGRLIGPANWNSVDAHRLIEYFTRH